MELHFICNRLNATVRRETVDGVEYVIAPVVAITEGVLNGELVTAEEIAHHFASWDGRPVTLGHPQKQQQFISANDPHTLSAFAVGQLFHTLFENDRIKGELWIDIDKANRSEDGRELLRRLDGGERVEVSTGYFRDFKAESGVHDGQPFDGIAYNIEPNHLAVLLHETGACSWGDGCGAPRVNRKEKTMSEIALNILSTARRPTFEGATDAEWERPSLGDYIAAMPDNLRPETESVEDMSAAAKRWIASKTLLGDPAASDFGNLSFFPVVTPGGDLSSGALSSVRGGRGSQADIPQGAKESAQAMAGRLLESEFETDSDNADDDDERREEPAHNRRGIWSAVQTFVNALGFNIRVEEQTMSEQQTQLMEGYEFTAEELQALPDGIQEKLVAHLAQPEPEPKTKTEPETEPQTNAGEPATPTLPADYQALLTLVNAVGADKLAALLTNTQQVEDDKRAALVAAIVANTSMTAEQLEELTTAALEALSKSISKNSRVRNYAGPGVGPQAGHKDEQLVALTF